MPRRPAPLSVSTPLTPSPFAPWLGVVGILMLLIAFAQHNGWFGFTSERWPWDVLVSGVSLLDKVLLALWWLTGLWCAALGFTGARRTRALGCVVLAVLLVAHVDVLTLLVLLSTGTLGAGLLVAREPATRGRGRVLATVGGLLALWILGFPLSAEGSESMLENMARGLSRLFGGDAPGTSELLETLLPIALVAVAALGGVLAGLGLTGRRTLAMWFFVLLGAWLLSVAGSSIRSHEGEGIASLGAAIVSAAFVSQILLWSLALFTVRDLASLGGGEA